MADLLVAILSLSPSTFLAFEISTGIVAGHTDAQLPKAALYGHIEGGRPQRSAYFVEVPLFVFLVGGGSLILLLMVVDPDSTIPVRLVAAAALVASAAWLAYIGWRLFQRR